jgi:hypothetical protein
MNEIKEKNMKQPFVLNNFLKYRFLFSKPLNFFVLGLIFICSQSFAQERNLVCTGIRSIFIVPDGQINPNTEPVVITFDEKKNYLESEFLSATCGNHMEPIKKCECVFGKQTISCSGLSKNINEPKNMWKFSFTLNRITGQLLGGDQFSNDGKIETPIHRSRFDYICKPASIKF